MTIQVLALDPAGYQPHRLHTADRTWAETNCYVDLWIEILHSLGLDPVAASAFTLEADFEGDQWSFFKFPPEDLRFLFGIEVSEMNVWRSVLEHVEEELRQGCLVTVEVDAWFLPDTRGVTYRSTHSKTTIVPQMLDIDHSRLGYFHNAGYFDLEGADFEGVFRLGASPGALPDNPQDWVPTPYMERVRLDRLDHALDIVPLVLELTRQHLSRRPSTNPMVRFAKRLGDDVAWLASQDLDNFHLYAFATCRQCGAAAELASSFVDWLDDHDGGGLAAASDHLRTISNAAKSLEFTLARVVRGRSVDVGDPLEEMERAWDAAMGILVDRYAA
jgi:hypothetical protein